MTTHDIQRALRQAGFDPGPIDGIRGRLTIRAVRAFQAANGLDVDGIVGRNTAERLSGVPDIDADGDLRQLLPWHAEARRLIGTREIAGSASNPVIMGWSGDLDIHYAGDDVPWCGLFVAHVIGSQLPDEPLPANPLGARNWLRFGVECAPRLGAVLGFWRGSRTGWQGHVGLYDGEDGSAYRVLGGNQSNRVNVARIAKSRLLGARWPLTAPMPGGAGTLHVAGGGALSTNEA